MTAKLLKWNIKMNRNKKTGRVFVGSIYEKKVVRKLRKIYGVRIHHHKKVKNVAYFFPNTWKLRRNLKPAKFSVLLKEAAVKKVAHKFRLSRQSQVRIINRYYKPDNLTKWQGAFLLALLDKDNLSHQFWGRYTIIHKHMEAIKKQRAYNARKFGPSTFYRKVLLRTIGATRFIKKCLMLTTFRPRTPIKKYKLVSRSFRQKAMLWRRVVLNNTRGARYWKLKFKFYKKTAQQATFKRTSNIRKMWKKRAWLNFRLLRLGNRLQSKNLSVEKLKELYYKFQYLKGSSKLGVTSDSWKKHLNWISKKIKVLTEPIPWWKQKRTKKSLVTIVRRGFSYNNKLQNKSGSLVKPSHFTVQWGKRRKLKNIQPFWMVGGKQHNAGLVKPTHRLMWFRWYQLPSLRFAVTYSGAGWNGASNVNLNHKYSRLKWKTWQKTGVYYLKQTGDFRWKRWYQITKLVALKTSLISMKPNTSFVRTSGNSFLIKNPILFSFKKAVNSIDFNKFFKINKVVARSIGNISVDIYSQYLANLQEGFTINTVVVNKQNSDNIHTVKVLGKYIKLLKTYFKEVHDSKVAKKIPASSALHWIREYLRLTSSVKNRVSLWNRFNKVSFHFQPKAKEEEKRGRKKKVLFKAKILFDRLFHWLYAQPDARYALGEPIQNGVIRDYIVRNQFIIKKGFKIKLATY